MAVMNEKQGDILHRLEKARASYEQFEVELAQRVADEKWARKKELRDLVREARQEQVPYRQIGIALRTSDHKTLKDYEQDIRR